MLTSAFCRHDHGMPAGLQALRQSGQQAAVALQGKRRLGNQHKIYFLEGQGGPRRNEAGFAAHQFDQADAVGRAASFRMRALNGLGGFEYRCLETEGLRDEVNVVVNGFRDADD